MIIERPPKEANGIAPHLTRVYAEIEQADAKSLKSDADIDFRNTFNGKLVDNGGIAFNVKHPDFGAIGDGATDDTAAIQAAIDKVESLIVENGSSANDHRLSGIVDLPPGDYVISEPLTILGSGVVFRGSGAGAATLYPVEGTGAIVVGDGTSGNRPINVVIKNLRISYDDGGTVTMNSAADTDTVAVEFLTADQLCVDDVTVFFDINSTVAGLTGFKYDDCELVVSRGCEVHENGGATTGNEAIALWITTASQNHGNMHFDSFYCRKCQVGLKIESTNLLNSLVFTNFKIVNSSMGASNDPRYGVWIRGGVHGVTFIDPHLEGQSGKQFDAGVFIDPVAASSNLNFFNTLLANCVTGWDLSSTAADMRNVNVYNTLFTGADTFTTAYKTSASVYHSSFLGATRITSAITTWLTDTSAITSKNRFGWSASSAGADNKEYLYRGHRVIPDSTLLQFGSGSDYWLHYNAAGTDFRLVSTDIDGGGTNGVIFKVDDGTDTFQVTRDLSVGGVIIGSVERSITASTTQTQGQQPLTAIASLVETVANANDVVTLPAAVAGLSCEVVNAGANTLQIFPASGDAIQGGATNASVTLGAGNSVRFRAFDSTDWYIG